MLKREPFLISIAVIAAFLAMAPSLACGFTNFDDNLYLTQNPKVFGLTANHLAAMFSTHHEGQYGPLTLLSFALQYHLWGPNPLPYHALNLFLHLVNSALVFALAKFLSKKPLVAFLTALLFAVHPVHVEPVVWISSRKDMLYSFFYLLSMLLYLNIPGKGGGKTYFGALLVFVLSLLSKPVAVTLPCVLWLTERYLPDHRPGSLRRLMPFFALSAIFGMVALLSHPASVHGSWTRDDLLQRSVAVVVALQIYVSKCLFPAGLSGLYPWPQVQWGSILLHYGDSIALMASFGVFAAWLAKRSKSFGFGALFFLAVVFPLLPFLKYSIAVAADKYIYLASFGFFFPIAVGLAALESKWCGGRPARRAAAVILAAACLLALARVSQLRCLDWKDSRTFWNNVIAQYPDSAFAYQRRGDASFEAGSYPAAIRDYGRVIALRPKNAAPYNNRGASYLKTGQFEKAIADLSRSIELDPNGVNAYNNRGAAYASLGRFQEAEKDFESALKIGPSSTEFQNNRRLASEQKARSLRSG